MEEQIETVLVAYDPDSLKVIGFYPSWVEYGVIPEPTISITREEHDEILQSGSDYIIQDGEVIPAPEPEITWSQHRVEAYGSIGDQLDMMYHDKEDGTDKWLEHIKSVKTKYPKD